MFKLPVKVEKLNEVEVKQKASIQTRQLLCKLSKTSVYFNWEQPGLIFMAQIIFFFLNDTD